MKVAIYEDNSAEQKGSDYLKYTQLQNKLTFTNQEIEELKKDLHYQEIYTKITESQLEDVKHNMSEDQKK